MLPGTEDRCSGKQARGSSHQGRMLKIHRAVPVDGNGLPGEVLCCDGQGLNIAAGDGAVCVQELQPEGRRRMSIADYVHGHTVCVGDLLE